MTGDRAGIRSEKNKRSSALRRGRTYNDATVTGHYLIIKRGWGESWPIGSGFANRTFSDRYERAQIV